MAQPTGAKGDPFAALKLRDYRAYIMSSVVAVVGFQVFAVAVGWELYQRTKDPMSLGWAGLARALPVLLLLVGGQLADRLDRRLLIAISQSITAVTAFVIYFISQSYGPIDGAPLRSTWSMWPYFAIIFCQGCAGAIGMPSRQSLLPQIVPQSVFANAVTWNSGLFHLALVAGPIVGGFILHWNLQACYLVDCAAMLIGVICTFRIRPVRATFEPARTSLKSLLAGVRFVFSNKVLLATMTLDLFATLFGGATALLPIYAADVLMCGESGLGWLRAGFGIGSFAMAFALVFMPTMRRAGMLMLWSVAGFGAATVIFGFATTLWMALVGLILTGVFDQVSVVVRHTLVQLMSPDRMRGRISAVNGIFIQSSNQLSEFESGAVAALVTWYVMNGPGYIPSDEAAQHARAVGASWSVVSGGIATIVVVIVSALIWPQVRKIGALHEITAAEEAEAEIESGHKSA